MKAIAAVDRKWGIGREGKLLQPIPEDMRFFKQMTWGKVVVMGRTTFTSLPGQKPLSNRVNIVLTTDLDFEREGIITCHTGAELLALVSSYPPDNVFIIGGESVYRQFLPYCTEALITKIEQSYPADTYFGNLDKDPAWQLAAVGEPKRHQGIEFRFCTYINTKPKS